MEYNTDLTFIPSSGGEILNLHHVEFNPLGVGFLPEGDAPSLPSGSLYVRANDGQLPMLNYQATSGIRGIRRGDTIACYSSVTSQALSGISEINRPIFETTVVEPSELIRKIKAPAGHDVIEVLVSGLYRFDCCARVDNPSNSTSLLTLNLTMDQPRSMPTLASPDSRYMESWGFSPATGDGGGTNLVVHNDIVLAAGDQISFQIQDEDTTVTPNQTLEEIMLTVELIKPLDDDTLIR